MSDSFEWNNIIMNSSSNINDNGGEWEEEYNPISNLNQASSFSQNVMLEEQDWEPVSSINNIIPTTTTTASSASQNIAVSQEYPGNPIQADASESGLNWLSTATKDEKLDFLKDALSFFNKSNELELAYKIMVNAKKRLERKRKVFKVPNEEDTGKRAYLYALKSSSNSDPTALQSTSSSEEVALQSVAHSELLALQSYEKPVFRDFLSKNIVAMDTEYVRLLNPPPGSTNVLRCGIISIVDFDGNSVYDAIVRIEPNSFVINHHTIKSNGIRSQNHFVNGKPFEEVKREVEEIFKNKLIVVCDGINDFKCLDLMYGHFQKSKENPNQDICDISNHFKKWRKGFWNAVGVPTYEKLSLRSVYHYYFPGTDFQLAAHSAKRDAQATMQLLREIIIPQGEINWTAETESCLPFDDNPYDPLSEILRMQD